ncbi:hypothetical protein [Orientia tsutsugamushi]|uniref:hypothetical protein n=1 Tax=Orientia tsutsugamushi TaxID=784 RepID=UPI003527AA19
MLKNNTDKTSKELASLYPRKIASSIILRTIKKLGYSYKKSFYHLNKSNNMLKNGFIETIKVIPKDKIAFIIDESGIEDNAYRNYESSSIGGGRYCEKAY